MMRETLEKIAEDWRKAGRLGCVDAPSDAGSQFANREPDAVVKG